MNYSKLTLSFLFVFFITCCVFAGVAAAEDLSVKVDAAADTTDLLEDGGVTTNASPSEKKPDVKEIQQALTHAGYYKGVIDGVKGSKTRNAIRAFQKDNGLHVDGKVGPKTWEKLKEHMTESIKTESALAQDLAASTLAPKEKSPSLLPTEEEIGVDSKNLKQKLVS